MKPVIKRLFAALVGVSVCSLVVKAQQDTLWKYVQPLAGTAGSTTPAAVKHGEGTEKNANTIPAVGMPFAMTQWTPQTQLTEQKCVPPYFYKDKVLTGFRGTHWLSGSCTQDYGSFTVMPVTGKLQTQPAQYGAAFSHEQEITTPAYYRLQLPAVITEITATERCGIMQFTLLQNDSLYLLVTPNSDKDKGFIKVNAQTGEIWGYNPAHRIYQGWGESAGFNGYFYIKAEKTATVAGTFSGATLFTTDSLQNKPSLGAYIGFALQKGEQLRIRVGTSFTSLQAAQKNLQQEIPAFAFATVLKQAQQTWQKALSQITVSTANEKDKRIFYTAMYHAMQHPRLFSDIDGTYPVFAGNYQLKQMKNGHYYDDFSMWDIYRAQLPLLEILEPVRVNDFVRSLVDKGTNGGWLPVFPCWNSYTAAMIGDHSTAFIASAWAKGIRNYDVQEAYRLMRQNAFTEASGADYKNGKGRRALTSYLRYGYIPIEDSVPEAFHKKEQVSRTLEYAYDDYALSVVAKGLGKTRDYQLLNARAANYKNVLDTSVGMVRARYANGSWYQPFRPDVREFYITEGTPRQYTFYVPQQVPELAKLMGGKTQLEKALDSLFEKGEYWHGNEPGHQIPFMYNYTNAPWKTQRQVRQILNDEYSDGPGGLSGNDDAGQMSAWYIFGAIGFYPVDPVSGQYQLCAPIFDTAVLQLPGNKRVTIRVSKQSASAAYIASVRWNGKPVATRYITHAMLQQGGVLSIALRDTPLSAH
ncbi:alpha-1,2-mannosidase, putative [Filimonas lacunae]|uniref:Alpha-1,2-mannosidase, putative n=1 Tax=Filimonas lacunae TaxID=477680 RepID=A0A173MM06_9BACT|nr:GH92 family glycosyl hydrolase [Filimonas lacunae]BAV08664.1 alpha-1,2-mannosidase [Filimonas lacunae]SIS59557.1 alpha-1,2-mannosidase, putative [Filimonas lacunae]